MRQDLHHRGGIPAGKCFFELFFQQLRLFRRIEGVDGGEIEGRRRVLPAPGRAAGQLIVLPPAESAHIVIQFLFLRVERVRAVLLNQKAVFVHIVIHISADVVPALPNGDLPPPLRKVAGYNGPGKAAANYKVVHIVTIPLYFLQ